MSLQSSLQIENLSIYNKAESEAIAEEIGLRYVTDRDRGFTRKRRGKGFVYMDHENNKISHDGTLSRIQSLVIPPAWEGVWICRFGNGHIQATGRDLRLRKQYRYHSKWHEARNETKFNKLLLFGETLPKIREQIEKDIKRNDFSREMVLAAVVRIMEETMIRIGNDEYAESNDSYGLTTIRNRHAKVDGSTVKFKFRGKSGIMREIAFSDKKLSRIVRRCQDLPGQELFGYIDSEGAARDIGSEDVNVYLKTITGEPITAKDFRTWGATVHAAATLNDMGPCETGTVRERKKRHCQAITAASLYLGNTTTVCRKYYVHPAILEADESGRLEEAFRKKKRRALPHLSLEEMAVLEILRGGYH